MKRQVLVALAVLVGAACASTKEAEKTDEPIGKQGGSSGGVLTGLGAQNAQVDAMKAMMAMQAGRVAAELRCAPLAKREVPFDEERFVGGYLANNRLRQTKLLELDAHSELARRVATVGKLLARRSARPDLPWTFGIVESDTPNASHVMGGYVFVTTGLLAQLTNEAELAGVLAREIAHVAARHPLTSYQQGLNSQCMAATMVAEMARVGVAPSPAQQELVRYADKFSQPPFTLTDAEDGFVKFLLNVVLELQLSSLDKEREFEADRLGAELTAFAGYDASQYEALLQKLEGKPYVAKKPATAERVAKLKALREGELAVFAHGTAKPDLSALVAPLKKP